MVKNFFSQKWPNYIYSESAQRDESIGTIFSLIGGGRLFGDPTTGVCAQSMVKNFFSQKWPNYIYSESAQRDESIGTIFSLIGEGRLFGDPTTGVPVQSVVKFFFLKSGQTIYFRNQRDETNRLVPFLAQSERVDFLMTRLLAFVHKLWSKSRPSPIGLKVIPFDSSRRADSEYI